MPIVITGAEPKGSICSITRFIGRGRGPAPAEIAMAALSHGCIKLNPPDARNIQGGVAWIRAPARACPWELAARASSGLIESEPKLWILVLTRFLHANRYPPRIKSGAGFRSKTLYQRYAIGIDRNGIVSQLRRRS